MKNIRSVDPRHHRWTAEEDALLGTMTDKKVATKLGVGLRAVTHRRHLLARPPAPAARPAWSQAQQALLGTMSDSDLAARIGRSEEAVQRRRHKLRIPVFPS